MPCFDRLTQRSLLAVTGAVLLTSLAGCGLFSKPSEQYDCPATAAVGDATVLNKFRDGPGRDLTDVRYQVRLLDVQSTCKYDSKGVTVQMNAAFASELGPANPDRNATYPFFVAITDPADQIVAKRIFTTALAFPANVGYVEHREELQQSIPLAKGGGAADYQIIIGLQLSQDELDYNRTHGRR